jgi:DNA (cytosine-5)-methyltransferase 1
MARSFLRDVPAATGTYYNEIDPYCARWLKRLGKAGAIPPGTVDRRSILDVRAADLAAATHAHFFAGIGGWPYALHLAGWPPSLPVWTGSCPCQPFSSAGRRKGILDARHLWPTFRSLIEAARPPTIFGEQVASAAGRAWLATVRADLEALGYAVGAADLCAASVGAPHIRQRLFWVALSGEGGQGRITKLKRHVGDWEDNGREEGRGLVESRGAFRDMGDAECQRVANARPNTSPQTSRRVQGTNEERQRLWVDPWQPSDALPCLDNKLRPVEPGTSPLAHGVPARVGRLRAYGNAIVPQVAAAFIRAVMAL